MAQPAGRTRQRESAFDWCVSEVGSEERAFFFGLCVFSLVLKGNCWVPPMLTHTHSRLPQFQLSLSKWLVSQSVVLLIGMYPTYNLL